MIVIMTWDKEESGVDVWLKKKQMGGSHGVEEQRWQWKQTKLVDGSHKRKEVKHQSETEPDISAGGKKKGIIRIHLLHCRTK